MSYEALTAHIINEGEKKASEIMAKARENADVMKAGIDAELKIRRENAYHELKEEIAGYRIKKLNMARLMASAVLAEARGDVIADVFRECDSALQSISESAKYPAILLQFLVEGLKNMHGRVGVVVNSRDVSIIRSFLNDKNINIETCDVISVSGDDRIRGGIEIISEDKSMSIVNTFRSRLEKVRADVMPEIGEILFG